jgi:hypothetical protein
MIMKKLCLYAVALLTLVGCENMGGLYPINASDGGAEVPAHFTWSGTGSGTLSVSMPGGEVMNGSFGPAYGSSQPFGEVFRAVYGPYSVLPDSPNKGSPTTATLKGNHGSSMKCEFYNDDYTDHGFGGCKASNGTLYRIKY